MNATSWQERKENDTQKLGSVRKQKKLCALLYDITGVLISLLKCLFCAFLGCNNKRTWFNMTHFPFSCYMAGNFHYLLVFFDSAAHLAGKQMSSLNSAVGILELFWSFYCNQKKEIFGLAEAQFRFGSRETNTESSRSLS